MRQIVCEDCGKRYDYSQDEFCPKCGAFNPPVRTWGTDAQGNVIRVDGVNERDHGGSFVHSEVHREKRVRQAKGMDWTGKAGQEKRKPPVRPPVQRSANVQPPPQSRKADPSKERLKTLLWALFILIFFSVIMPLLTTMFRLF